MVGFWRFKGCVGNKSGWVCPGSIEPERGHLGRPSLVYPSAYWYSAPESPWHLVDKSLNEGSNTASTLIIRVLGWVAQTEYEGRGGMLGFSEGLTEGGGSHAGAWVGTTLLLTKV